MTDKEFDYLKMKIRLKMWELQDLQKIHRVQTGQDYQMPTYLDHDNVKLCDECDLVREIRGREN
jgi:hypothetical protein